MTAVEFMVKEISEILGPLKTEGMTDLLLLDAYKQAKEMEKEQIMEAVSFGDCRGRVTTYLTDEEYYNEIYGK